MNKLFLFACFLLVACSAIKVVPDPVPISTIDAGYPRIETEICGQNAIGENGCAFPDGAVSGKLRIFKAYAGNISITGEGCKVDQNFEYAYDPKNQWLEIDLQGLLGPKLGSDCILSLYQFIKYPGADQVSFPISGIYGTVTLGTCPAGAKCSFSGQTLRAGWKADILAFDEAQAGQYALRGCGQELIAPRPFQGGIRVDLNAIWPGGFPAHEKSRCLFILGVVGSDGSTYKVYHKVTVFNDSMLMLNAPSLVGSTNLDFVADDAVSMSIVGEQAVGNFGSFKPSPDGDLMRFYTVQGRTLQVFQKGSQIVWIK